MIRQLLKIYSQYYTKFSSTSGTSMQFIPGYCFNICCFGNSCMITFTKRGLGVHKCYFLKQLHVAIILFLQNPTGIRAKFENWREPSVFKFVHPFNYILAIFSHLHFLMCSYHLLSTGLENKLLLLGFCDLGLVGSCAKDS